jgi:DNA-binding NtrC family response regulator
VQVDVDASPRAQEALGWIREKDYACALVEYVMPEMSGLSWIEAARSLRPGLRCFVLSGHERPQGVDPSIGWIEKPIDMDQLVELLRKS